MSRRPTEEGYDPAPKTKPTSQWRRFKREIGRDGLTAIVLGLFTGAVMLQIGRMMSLPALFAIAFVAIALIFVGSWGN